MNSTARDVWLVSIGATLVVILVLLFLFYLLGKRQNIYVAIVLMAVAFDKLTGVVGIPLYINDGDMPDEYAWLRTTGTIVVFVSVFIYGLHRFGLMNGVKSDDTPPPSTPPQ